MIDYACRCVGIVILDESSLLSVSTSTQECLSASTSLYNRQGGLFVKILDIVFPKRCLGCGKGGKYFCQRCTSIIRVIERNEAICPVCERPAIGGATHPRCRTRYGLDGLTSFFHYDGSIRKAVKALKYRYVYDLAQEFTTLIPSSSFVDLTKLLSTKPLSSFLIPIPLHPTRLRERGYNQAEILGALIAQQLQIPMRTDLLYRVRKTTPQVEVKKREERLKNMEKVFAANNVAMKQWNNVFLFDDVFTTGATMRSAANVLKRSGTQFVWGVTMAR